MSFDYRMASRSPRPMVASAPESFPLGANKPRLEPDTLTRFLLAKAIPLWREALQRMDTGRVRLPAPGLQGTFPPVTGGSFKVSNDSDASAAVGAAATQAASAHPLVDAILKISLAVAGVLVALTVIFYFLVYVPTRDHQAATERDRQARAVAQAQRDSLARQAKARADQSASVKAALDSCLAGAGADYTANWDHACQARALTSGCALPSYETQSIVATRENAKARCVEVARYGLPPSH
jgi:hypothetical protein